MALHFYYYIFFHLWILIPIIQSQNNTTNATSSPFSTTIHTTIFQTTIEPSQSSYPSLSPTITSLAPTLSPTFEGCTAIHGYVQTTLTSIGQSGQINSYPVSYGPQVYRIFNRSIAVFPAPLGTELDPCNKSLFNRDDIVNKVVLIDATLYTPDNINCNYQQWTLNFQSLGAKALLIGENIFRNYNGDKNLNNPRIPTRFIHSQSVFTITNEACGLSNYNCAPDDTIKITLDCNNNTAPEWICIEDEHYGRDDYYRINGEYEQLAGSDINGHPVWQQDSTYNIDSTIDWQIYFDINTYFNWVIGEGPGYPPVKAYCNDSITDDPTNCSIWYKLKTGPNNYFEKVNSIIILGDICPMVDMNRNTTQYCIRSQSDDMIGYIGTYKQLIEGIPEWFYENHGDVSVLYWSDFLIFPNEMCYGWKIKSNIDIAYCCYDNNDISINNTYIRFQPYKCIQWLDKSQNIDHTFDVDGNICENNINSNTNMICVQYEINTNGDYSLYSGAYEIINATYIYNHRIWQWDTYNILYYEINDEWVIINGDYNNINSNNMIGHCADKLGIYSDPTLCMNWISINTSDSITMNIINNKYECDAIIITTTTQIITNTNDNNDSGEGAGGKGKKGLAGFGLYEYIAIGAALLAFPICIVCFVCYQKRKSKKKHTDDEGISLQPYVPTGMAYDSYKQNQSHQLAQQAAVKKKDMDTKRHSKNKIKTLRAAAPTSVASASAGVNSDGGGDTTDAGNESLTVDSTNALIGHKVNKDFNPFEEDDAMHVQYDEPTLENEPNPFLRDDMIRTGQTIDETQQRIDVKDIMSAFDE